MIIWADYVSQGHDDEMDTLVLQFRHLLAIADDHGRHWFFNIQLEPSLLYCFDFNSLLFLQKMARNIKKMYLFLLFVLSLILTLSFNYFN